MLELKKILKTYKTTSFTQTALNKVSVSFRNSDFVSILGPSGSGKTTMLNIIGGLDNYDSGDLVIDGISTKKYKAGDWDSYRNNKIGFVFQNYNLIPHRTILSNVELSLQLSGVSKSECHSRAVEALKKVGLKEHILKKPNELSGGQMQRVAIARALINDPEILMADEPTGALDTKTSVEIMKLLKEISKDKLVIMVTHNNKLAEQYSTRIISLTDGEITNDTNPFNPKSEKISSSKINKASMPLLTSLSLSFTNLLTKKGRTIMTSFAGSIGIIGIAAILALSNGVNAYVKSLEEDTLSMYPVTIQKSGLDLAKMMDSAHGEVSRSKNEEKKANELNEAKIVNNMFDSSISNDLKTFKTHIDKNTSVLNDYVSAIEFGYNITPQIYLDNTKNGISQVNPDDVISKVMTGGLNISLGGSNVMGTSVFSQMPSKKSLYSKEYEFITGTWPKKYDETVLVLTDNGTVSDFIGYSLGLRDRDELKKMVEAFVNEEKVKSFKDNKKYTFDEILSAKLRVVNSADIYTYNKDKDIYIDNSNNTSFMKKLIEKSLKLKITGIVKPNKDSATGGMLSMGINYLPSLTDYLIDEAAKTDIVKDQIKHPDTNVLTGKKFSDEPNNAMNFGDFLTIDRELIASAFNIDASKIGLDMDNIGLENLVIDQDKFAQMLNTLMTDFFTSQIQAGVTNPQIMMQNFQTYMQSSEVQQYLGKSMASLMNVTAFQKQLQKELSKLPSQIQNAMSIDTDKFAQAIKFNASSEDIQSMITQMMNTETVTKTTNLQTFGYADRNDPDTISIFPKDFEAKQKVKDFIEDYNKKMQDQKKESKVITYSDLVGILMSSVTTIVNMVSYVLIAFVSISLIVSSIMIGVITLISVLERKKEIGILRAIGARKKDIRNIFNAETLMIGFCSGLFGCVVTALMTIPANIIVYKQLDVPNIAILPFSSAVILIVISMLLTFIAGIIPASRAAKITPVEALRSE